jgi:rfaE bifunctional protein nucleotidyltransferase chain/domain
VDPMIENSLRLSGRVKLRTARTLSGPVADATRLVADCLRLGGRGFIAGNGGSAADAQHFAAEFTGRFRLERAPLPMLALTTDTSALTSIANDYSFDDVFVRQLVAFGRPGDVFFALSTSGNSPSILVAAQAAKERGITVIGMTGASGGKLGALSHLHIAIPSGVTARIQESTMAALHAVCDGVERALGVSGPPVADVLDVRLDHTRLETAREAWREQDLKVVTTNGCFDVLHAGHLSSLRQAAALGDLLVVLVNSDVSVHRLKGEGRPVNAEADRVELLAALDPVDHVVVFEEDDPCATLELIRPSAHCKGEDYRGRPMPEEEVVTRHGGRIVYLSLVGGLSTTGITQRLATLGRRLSALGAGAAG